MIFCLLTVKQDLINEYLNEYDPASKPLRCRNVSEIWVNITTEIIIFRTYNIHEFICKKYLSLYLPENNSIWKTRRIHLSNQISCGLR